MKKRLTLNTVAEALRAFPPLSHRCALREGGRHQCGGAALARWLLAWAAPVSCDAPADKNFEKNRLQRLPGKRHQL